MLMFSGFKTHNTLYFRIVLAFTLYSVPIQLHRLDAQVCQDGVEMHTNETHCSTLGALAVVLASRFIMSWCTVPRVSCLKVSYVPNH